MKALPVLFLAALLPAALPVASAAPVPQLCPSGTSVAVPDGSNGWIQFAVTRLDFYVETNGVAGLQISSCTTLDGTVAPADTYDGSLFLPMCLNVPLVGYICIL